VDFAARAILAGMSAYDPQPRRGRTAIAVLLATALLAVLGAAFGYLLGVRANDRKATAGNSSPGPTADAAPTGKPCPDFIQDDAAAQGAGKPLTLRLYVATKKQGAIGPDDPYRSEVWICAAASAPPGKSRLWYQGHAIRTARFPAEQIVNDPSTGNGILLNPANSIDNGKYTATYTDTSGNSTTYTVSAKQLEVRQNTGTRIEPVVLVDNGSG
jgi:hypothetical protein